MKRALLSVSDKTGLLDLAKCLVQNKVEIISTGGTGKFLTENKILFTPIEEVTGNPEAFDGRMKTLSFQIESGLLFKRNDPKHVEEARKLNIPQIDLVVCNLYPFEEVARKGGTEEQLIENIDIGGPTMIRSAAKNFESVCVLTNPSDYEMFIKSLNHNDITLEMRKQWALSAFERTANYDLHILRTLSSKWSPEQAKHFPLERKALRYGENPHQEAYLLVENTVGITHGKFIQGKELSYNNFMDADAAWKCTSELHYANQHYHWGKNCTVTIIKHGNPCGVAMGNDPLKTLEMAWSCDNVSAFGSILCFDHEVTDQQAHFFGDKFIEVIIAPRFSKRSLEILNAKKNLRLIEYPLKQHATNEQTVRSIAGGLLVQTEDEDTKFDFQIVTKNELPASKLSLAHFGKCAGKYLKSNSIGLFAEKNGKFILAGAGMGQPNRLDSLEMLAAPRAKKLGHDLKELVLVSDAFFPFSDSIEACAQFGIRYIVQPGGSIRDREVIEAANVHQMAMVFTGKRHFRH